jgi:hypothetical protein
MKALIFVYAPTNFRIAGTQPLKQLQFGSMKFSDSPSVPRPATGDYQLPGGVYLVYADGNDVHPDVTATSGARGIHYDTLELRDKDPWPTPPLVGGTQMADQEFQPLRDSIRTKMQKVFEDQLCSFTASLGK